MLQIELSLIVVFFLYRDEETAAKRCPGPAIGSRSLRHVVVAQRGFFVAFRLLVSAA
jgi:hypothetical protein